MASLAFVVMGALCSGVHSLTGRMVGELFRGGNPISPTSSILALSPDGLNLYTGFSDSINSTYCIRTYVLPDTESSQLTCGLSGTVASIRVAPGGSNVYVGIYAGSFRWAITRFSRDAVTGALELAEQVDAGGAMISMSISADGTSLYGLGTGELSDQSPLAAYSIQPGDGQLTFLDKYNEVGYSNAAGNVAVSPDGLTVYAEARNTLAVYERDPETGLLRFETSGTVGSGAISALCPIGDFLYLADSSGTLYVYTSTPVLLETYSTIGDGRPGLLVFPDSVHLANGASLISFARDAGTGLLTRLSHVTDDAPSQLPPRTLVGSEGMIYTGSGAAYLREADTQGTNSTDYLNFIKTSGDESIMCTLKATDKLTSDVFSCDVVIDLEDDRTYSCSAVENENVFLEIDRVSLRADPSTPISLVRLGWQDPSGSYTRFNLNCQDALSSQFSCTDTVILGPDIGITESFELFVSEAFLTLCRGTQCCVLPAEGGYCSPPGYTVTSVPLTECQTGWRLSSDFTNLDMCLVQINGALDPPRLLQAMSRFGRSGREAFALVFDVACQVFH